MAGIVSYGVYIPKYRIKLSEIANVFGKDEKEVASGLKVFEKSVAGFDEDAVTLAVEAAYRAINLGKISPQKIESIFVGSESHPYAVKPSTTIVADALGLSGNYFAADLQFACKAGSAAIQVTIGLLESGKIKYGMAIGTDVAEVKPRDILEFTGAAGAAAFILGKDDKEIIARILATSSFSSNTPDFWRRSTQRYPSHFGRFTGEPAYFNHVVTEGQNLLAKTKLKPKDFGFCVFHMPNGKFPRKVAKNLGFNDLQLAPSLVVDHIGNPYSGSSLIGLSAVLNIAKPNQKIFFVSYGSGAGADGFVFETTARIKNYQLKIKGNKVQDSIEKKQYISYVEYLKMTHKI